MPGASVAQLVRVATSNQTQVLTLRDRSVRTLAATWSRVMTNPSDFAAAQWVQVAGPLLQAAQQTAAGLALSYIGTYVAVATGQPTPASTLTAADFLNPRGVPLGELLMRPVIEMRSKLANGATMLEATAAGGARAAQIGATDPMLSYRAASSEAMQQNPRVVGYRRVPDARACKFCLLVSTQRYTDGDLMPLHPHCGCTVAPIVGSKDPGRVLDKALLDRLKGEGVIDDINRQRQAQGSREAQKVADGYQAKADHWTAEADKATDPATKRRYEARAADWAQKAKVRAGDLPPANVDAGQALINDIFNKPQEFVTVHQHGELGPTLYEAGHHFEAA